MNNLYQVCGQTSTGELIHYPLQTQVVAEVPEYLETSQKHDRRRDHIFPHNDSDSSIQPGVEKHQNYSLSWTSDNAQ